MKTVMLPSGERVPAFGMGTWNMGDDAATREEGRANLATWYEETRLLAMGSPRHPITRAVARAMERFSILGSAPRN